MRWTPLKFATLVGWHTGRKSHWTKSGGKMTKTGRAAWRGRLPLTDRGILRRRATTGATILVTPRSFEYEVNDIRAAIHQFGGQAGRGHKSIIPARPYLMFQKEDIAYFERSLLEHVLNRRLV